MYSKDKKETFTAVILARDCDADYHLVVEIS
jgi:hypothetical protein